MLRPIFKLLEVTKGLLTSTMALETLWIPSYIQKWILNEKGKVGCEKMASGSKEKLVLL